MVDDDGTAESGAQSDQFSPKPVIVGVGASAGGVQTLQTFFDALPDASGAAFVVVVHLDPKTRSDLANILASHTRMRVAQVQTTLPLQENHVYLIPPDRRLDIADNHISSAPFDEPRGQRAPIDLFFRSLAEQHGDGFAVILTGAGADGAVGVRAVKEAGGIILVQDPNEAEYASMPRSAIATGVADFVLPVRDLAQRLTELIRNKDSDAMAAARNFDEGVLRRILAHVRVRTGHDFSKYKRSTVVRRIARRMTVTRTVEPRDYYEILRDNEDEAQALLSDLLISVTTFFRDGEAFEALKNLALPELFHGKERSDTIRVWTPGCATGEETYTVAMLLMEEASKHEIRPSLQVFGSDLDARALTIAREGRFPAAIEADISEERLRRFFVREGDHYRVRQELRDIVLFANHSLLKDPPFSRLDLISCRNLLIYLDRELQQQACSTFHYALKPNGFLLLGSSETADNPAGLFRTIDRKARLYQSTAQPSDKPRLLPRLLGGIRLPEQTPQFGRMLSPSAVLNEAASHRQAIERLAPPSVLVDRSHRVVHLSDNAGRFLQPSGGALSGDIVDLARPELRFELRSALHRVFERGQSTLSLPILVRFNGSPHRVHIQVKPAEESGDAMPHNAVVLFIEGEPVEQGAAEAGSDQIAAHDEVIRRLKEELQLTQARLRTTREESDAANEELRAANEELQSINEEYRSTSEELETSKEELQSINEELQTVNSELKLKLEAVSRAHGDLQNLMAATDFGTLFLDSSLRIKRFTQPVTELFSITPSDEGRPVTDFAHRLEYEHLTADAQAVLARLTPIQHEIRSRDNRWYDLRLRPYRTVDDKIDGVVITFVDITGRKQVDEALRASEQSLRQVKRLVEVSRNPIFIWDFDNGGVLEWNRGCEELYGYSRDEALGKKKDKLLATIADPAFGDFREKLADEGSWNGELKHTTKSGRELTVESRLVLDTIEGKRLVLESTQDITERREWEKRQRLLLAELTHRVKNTLTVVQAIATQTLRAYAGEDFIARFSGRLSALAAAHNLLVQTEWKGADLGALARSQLEAYLLENPDRVRLEGEPVLLPADLATPFGLVVHELATNAAKYGSLSRPGGTVHVAWSVISRNEKPAARIVWREEGGPPARRPKTGFGTSLIERGIPDAVVTNDFGPSGLVCTIEIPLPEGADHGAGR
ncbi:MAG TPA: chemotaxis protein CheB [Roseiarcus sp.]|nr:chemotaxis protein CheB [Roseiarcus sp.]